jgi:hypothetical protein
LPGVVVAVGLGTGLTVGFGVGLGVGFGVGLGVGFGVGGGGVAVGETIAIVPGPATVSVRVPPADGTIASKPNVHVPIGSVIVAL